MPTLSLYAKYMTVLAVVLLIANIMLSLCIITVLPDQWTSEDYISTTDSIHRKLFRCRNCKDYVTSTSTVETPTTSTEARRFITQLGIIVNTDIIEAATIKPKENDQENSDR